MRLRSFLLIILLFASGVVFGQNTVGLISSVPAESFEGYNLFFSHNQEKTFLIDNEGQIIHFWNDEDSFRPGNSVYLLPNGDLIRCKRPNNFSEDAIWAGGGGAIVEVIDWDGNRKNSFELNNDEYRLHHDVAPMANGNILMFAWTKVDSTTAANNGRDPSIITQSQVWSERLIEWNPTNDEIVWEWNAFDHLIQDRFPDLPNYGDIAENKTRIDVNYDEHDGHPDWLHINSIDYNEALDQIVVSVPYFNELWVIDHSTTTEQAATSSGGNAGVGGDLVYRWGNSKTFQSASSVEQKMFFQHDVHWVSPNAQLGDEDFGQMLLFNNRLPDETSESLLINTIDPNTGEYFMDEVASSDAVLKSIKHPENSSLAYSTGLSGAQLLPNGNFLILSGRWGYAYELNESNELVWEYRIPINGGEIAPQGSELGLNNNITFRLKRFPIDYAAFQGRDMSQKGLLEEFEDEDDVVTSTEREDFSNLFNVYPNPATDQFNIMVPQGFLNKELAIEIIELGSGRIKARVEMIPESAVIPLDIEMLSTGINLIRISNQEGQAVKKVIRLK